MPRWHGSLSDEEVRALDEFFKKLKAHAPKRWSIVKSDGGLVIRPADRRIGKFSLTPSTDGTYYVAFYTQKKPRWADNEHFEANDGLVIHVMEWMTSIAARSQLRATKD